MFIFINTVEWSDSIIVLINAVKNPTTSVLVGYNLTTGSDLVPYCGFPLAIIKTCLAIPNQE